MEGLSSKQERAAQAIERMQEWAREHGEWRAQSCINLIAATNVMSPAALAALSSRLADKPISGTIGSREHTGGRYADLIETTVKELARELFDAATVEYRPMSGNLANLVAIQATLGPGDTILVLPAGARCHSSHRRFSALLGARLVEMPYDFQEFDVDLEAVGEVVRRERPKVIAVGTPQMLFPYRLRELRSVADEVGALVLYDGAHPLGLIAGGEFQRPLAEGAHIVTGSTQKTLPGPVGGLVITGDEELGKAVTRAAGTLISNYQNNRVLALGITLAEMLAFGREYAAACVENGQALARSLAAEGFALAGAAKGYTRSNKIVLDMRERGDPRPFTRALEAANITSTAVGVQSPTFKAGEPPNAIRIGVQEVTRLGMGPGEVATVARLMARVWQGESPERVGREVTELARAFQRVYYCFEAPLPPSRASG